MFALRDAAATDDDELPELIDDDEVDNLSANQAVASESLAIADLD